jgi:hypothetical protein
LCRFLSSFPCRNNASPVPLSVPQPHSIASSENSKHYKRIVGPPLHFPESRYFKLCEELHSRHLPTICDARVL